jgi:fluoroquinolone transport system ATP-binding protein
MIKTEDLSFKYPGSDATALQDISFSVGEGSIFGFLGPSGAGKSTMQKILYGLLKGYTGSATLLGKELWEWDRSLYSHIGVCFELPNHYQKLTAMENLSFFRGFYKTGFDPAVLLRKVGLADKANVRVAEFSKGMKMRLNFIRALLHDPQILFLDEPTSGLDPVNARIIKDMILEEKRRGKTIFLTTHQMHDADELCDVVAFLVNGKICATGTPASMRHGYSRNEVEVIFSGSEQPLIFGLQGIGQNPEFIRSIATRDPLSIHTREASLDDIFIKVTGHSLQ